MPNTDFPVPVDPEFVGRITEGIQAGIVEAYGGAPAGASPFQAQLHTADTANALVYTLAQILEAWDDAKTPASARKLSEAAGKRLLGHMKRIRERDEGLETRVVRPN